MARKTMLSVVVMAVFGLSPISAAFAAEEQAGQAKAVSDPQAATRPSDEMDRMPIMAHMERMQKLEAALEEAKGAAEAKGDKVAADKVDEALKLLQEDHKAMHRHVVQMMHKMKGQMKEMRSMQQDMQQMQEQLGASEQTKPMQAKMKAMEQKMAKMREQMMPGAREGEMKCPMCKKMMGGKEESSANGAMKQQQ